MAPPSSHEVIRAAYSAFASRDLDALTELASPEVEVRTMTGFLARRDEPYRGHAGLALYLDDAGAVWDELELTPAEFHDLDDGSVLVFGRVRARRGSTIVDSPTAWRWRLEEGLVTSATVFGDADSAVSLLTEGA